MKNLGCIPTIITFHCPFDCNDQLYHSSLLVLQHCLFLHPIPPPSPVSVGWLIFFPLRASNNFVVLLNLLSSKAIMSLLSPASHLSASDHFFSEPLGNWKIPPTRRRVDSLSFFLSLLFTMSWLNHKSNAAPMIEEKMTTKYIAPFHFTWYVPWESAESWAEELWAATAVVVSSKDGEGSMVALAIVIAKESEVVTLIWL